MCQPKVSVIIPVYRVEEYIEKCAKSLFAQTLDYIEYIFIDDCSPDNSVDIMLQVLEAFPKRKSQVKIIKHKKNKGVSQSRQDGVDEASGEYIIHCDPDDWVELNMYETLYKKAKENNADLVICDISFVSKDGLSKIDQAPSELTSISLLEGIAGRKSKVIHGSTCNKLLKSEYYRSAYFPSDVSYCEDVYLWFQVLKKRLRICYIPQSYYYYRMNTSSIVSTITEQAQRKDINLINHIRELYKDSDSKRYKDACQSFILSVIYFRFMKTNTPFNLLDKNKITLGCINLNKRINPLDKFFLKLYLKGYDKQTIEIRKFVKKLISYLPNH